MAASGLPASFDAHTAALVGRESRLQRLVTVYIATGLLFMLLPGTFLGVWNLLCISAQHTVASLSPAWLQAHGHAQIFGWLGTFILGIGFYSLSKMGNLPAFAVSGGWVCFGLWTAGVLLRWAVNITEWEWRLTLPLSAALELSGFLIFLRTVSQHSPSQSGSVPRTKEPWMLVVIGSTMAFFVTLLANLAATIYVVVRGDGPAIPFVLDQRLLMLPTLGLSGAHRLGFQRAMAARFSRPARSAAAISLCGSVVSLGGVGSDAARSCDPVDSFAARGRYRRHHRVAGLRDFHAASQTQRSAPKLPSLHPCSLHLATDCIRVIRRCGTGRSGRRYLGRLAPRSHRRISRDHGIFHRPEDPAGILWWPCPVQPWPDVCIAAAAQCRLHAARLFRNSRLRGVRPIGLVGAAVLGNR